MKTIDLLVQELPALGGFPEGAVEAGFLCSDDTLYFVDKDGDCPSEWRISMNYDVEDRRVEVTRDQYEAALAAKNDGWIDWGGGKRPVDNATELDIKFRTGGIVSGVEAGKYYWPQDGHEYDIIAYRLHQPQEATESDDEADLNECIGQDVTQVWSGEGLPPVGCECEYTMQTITGDDWNQCTVDYVGSSFVVYRDCCGVELSCSIGCIKFRPILSEAEQKRDESLRVIYEILDAGTSTKQDAEDIYDAIAAGKIPGVKLED